MTQTCYSPRTRFSTKRAAPPAARVMEAHEARSCAGAFRRDWDRCLPRLVALFAVELQDSLYLRDVLDHFPWLLKVSITSLTVALDN